MSTSAVIKFELYSGILCKTALLVSTTTSSFPFAIITIHIYIIIFVKLTKVKIHSDVASLCYV